MHLEHIECSPEGF